MKIILIISLVVLLTLTGCKDKSNIQSISYINTKDNIIDKDEIIIKEFRSHHRYSNDELRNLEIKYLRTVDDYKIYYVPFNKERSPSNDWIKEGYTFPSKSHTRIIGIKSNRLYTIGELIHETKISIKQLYEVLPQEFKAK